MTYNPRDAFTDVLSGQDAKQIAESITSELESASPKMIDNWFTEFVNMTAPSTRHIGPWTDRIETYGGVTIRARPTTGPSCAKALSGLEGYRLAAQGWLETFHAGEPLEIQIVKAEKGAAPGGVMNAIEQYKARHYIVRGDNQLTIITLTNHINEELINQPWYKAYVQHRAAIGKPTWYEHVRRLDDEDVVDEFDRMYSVTSTGRVHSELHRRLLEYIDLNVPAACNQRRRTGGTQDMRDTIRDLLIKMSDGQIDASMHPLLEKWSEPPTALQVLEVLDKCVHGNLASGFVVTVLQAAYDQALAREETTHEIVVQGATWRTS